MLMVEALLGGEEHDHVAQQQVALQAEDNSSSLKTGICGVMC